MTKTETESLVTNDRTGNTSALSYCNHHTRLGKEKKHKDTHILYLRDDCLPRCQRKQFLRKIPPHLWHNLGLDHVLCTARYAVTNAARGTIDLLPSCSHQQLSHPLPPNSDRRPPEQPPSEISDSKRSNTDPKKRGGVEREIRTTVRSLPRRKDRNSICPPIIPQSLARGPWRTKRCLHRSYKH